MTEETPLDSAKTALDAAGDDDTLRLRFYERLADAELFLMLASEPTGENEHIEPRVFTVQGGDYVLVFDREERMVDFAGEITPYAAMSGRAITSMLAGQGVGLALNPEVAPSSTLIPAEAIDWLAGVLAEQPDQQEEVPEELLPPLDMPELLLQALDAKLATAAGLARTAYLAAVRYRSGRQGNLLVFTGVAPQAHEALSQAVREALVFSGVEAGELDVVFLQPDDPAVEVLERVGLRVDLPQPEPASASPDAPGSDPDAPPRLR
jgi:hypothetical protein